MDDKYAYPQGTTTMAATGSQMTGDAPAGGLIVEQDMLTRALSHLAGRVDNLYSRLGPLLLPSNPTSADESKQSMSACSSYAQGIAQQRQMVETVAAQIEDVLERLDA